MHHKNFFTFCLVGILIYSVSSLEAGTPFPVVVVGEITQATFQSETPQRPTPQPAVYLGAQNLSNSIIFVGDVLLARNIEFLMKKNGLNYPYLGFDFKKIAENPYVIGNFEGTVPRVHFPTENLKMKFSVDAQYLMGTKKAGFTHLSLANNHSFDYSQDGFLSTIEKLRGVDLLPFGNPENLSHDSVAFITLQKKTISVIGIHTVVETPTQAEIDSLFKFATSKSDLQVVYIHWGIEYNKVSNLAQRTLAKRLVLAGADIIIGHHPHVVQEVSVIDGVPVFYSLGNYIFDQYASKATQEGLMISIDMSSDPMIYLIPVTSQYSHSQPTHMSDKERQVFLGDLAKRSDAEIRPYIKHGVVTLNSLVATSSKIAIMSR